MYQKPFYNNYTPSESCTIYRILFYWSKPALYFIRVKLIKQSLEKNKWIYQRHRFSSMSLGKMIIGTKLRTDPGSDCGSLFKNRLIWTQIGSVEQDLCNYRWNLMILKVKRNVFIFQTILLAWRLVIKLIYLAKENVEYIYFFIHL